ncbi:MAG: class I SAM-dependent methyltransferase [Chloroflexi bacterium]|nr:class I SAM-dependent methyltransferase [Chloroflexota bacterium]
MLESLPYFRAILRAVEAAYYQDLALPGPVLDVGCGDGHFASIAFQRKLKVGLDPHLPSLREAKRWAAYDGLVQADGARAPFPSAHFGSALSNSVLEHIPELDNVLKETGRMLKKGAPFLFCVPNPTYFKELGVPRLLPFLREPYEAWFRRISRVHHAENPEQWEARLKRAGFTLDRWWHYFSPAAMRTLDWGHYFGAPTILPRILTRRWLFSSAHWNLALTAKLVGEHATLDHHKQGAFTFYVSRKV